ncbi:Geranylgeranyl transferase type-2 subunit alpha 1 [Camellia lanceoleosa]|uniref:Geranylgeranyl transferase type-2 subunit alpha 1 n=1 Tax=Camellia lanceoleosa TaxID=1840588 RepID=A0ACC0G1D9_9ERIC|nr:Geranylgeranyl transferase type-2 subunit alpha 1 [Camellia lanceoleosa]
MMMMTHGTFRLYDSEIERCYTKEALEVNAKLLEANPEYLTAWNYRKLVVEHILSHSETDTEIDPDSIKPVYSEELRVVRLSEPLI